MQSALIVSIKCSNKYKCVLVALLVDVTSGFDGIELPFRLVRPMYISNSVEKSIPT